MARGNYRDYLQGSEVKIKKYFYVLKPILACAWIERNNEIPPLDFNVLVQELLPQDSELRDTVQNLLFRKMSGEELSMGPRLDVLNVYLEQQIAHYENIAPDFDHGRGIGDDTLDELFRAALIEVWGETEKWNW